jgi:glycosyltransferase involved in cell wall biosynthesis
MVQVSILIPVYNRSHLISASIQSALDQTFDDLEVIVADNCSTDGTWEVCKAYSQKDPRVRVFRNEENLGPVRNWKRCLDEARGSFGKVLFSDDLMMAEFLERTLPAIQDPEVGFVYTAVEIGPEPGQGQIAYREKAGMGNSSQWYRHEVLRGSHKVPVSPSAALFRMKDLRKNLMLDIPSPSYHDFSRHGAGPDELLFLLTAADYPRVVCLDQPLVFFRGHPGSITRSTPTPYLNNHRHQARIWFASQYESPEILQGVMAYAWVVTCSVERKWHWPNRFIKRFLDTRNRLGPRACCKAFFRRIREFLILRSSTFAR